MTRQSHMNGRPENLAYPTHESIASWEAECAKIREEIERLQSRHDAFAAMISGAKALIPDSSRAVIVPEKTEAHKPSLKGRRWKTQAGLQGKTWTATLEKMITEAGRISYDDLKARVSKSHLGSKFAKSEKSFYGAIAKLSDAKVIVRHNGWLFSSKELEKFLRDVADGKAVDEKAPRAAGQSSPFGEAIKSYLDGNPSGATSAQLIEELRKEPEFADTIERHKSHAYNVLSRLVDQGEVLKGGGKYYRSPNRDGASS